MSSKLSDVEKGPTEFPIVSDPGQPFDPSKFENITPGDGRKDPLEGLEVVPKLDLYDFLEYRSSGNLLFPGDNRVWTGRINIYNRPGDEALHAVVTRRVEGIHWVQLMSWRNNLSEPQHFDQEYTTALTVTEGREVERGINMGASFRGLSFGVNSSVRTFSARETTTSQTTTLRVTVPANSLVVFYQRRYDFRDDITFVNDAWGREWNVGSWGAYEPLTMGVSRVQIMADEYFTSERFLPRGPGSFNNTPIWLPPWGSATRRRENVTSRARDAIANMGI